MLLQPPADCRLVRLQFDPATGPPPAFPGSVTTPAVTVTHDPAKAGGLPSRIEFRTTGKTFPDIRWQDRLHDPQRGGFRVADDRAATVSCVADGPLCTVIQVAARYVAADQKAPPSAPSAVYQWFYFRDLPLIYVTVTQRQQQAFSWSEAAFPGTAPGRRSVPAFRRQRTGPGPVRSKASSRAIGSTTGPGCSTARTGSPCSPPTTCWSTTARAATARTCTPAARWPGRRGAIGCGRRTPGCGSAAATTLWRRLGEAGKKLPRPQPLVVSVQSVRARLNELRRQADGRSGRPNRWQIALAEQLEAAGRWTEALQVARGELPGGCRSLDAGDLNLVLDVAPAGHPPAAAVRPRRPIRCWVRTRRCRCSRSRSARPARGTT